MGAASALAQDQHLRVVERVGCGLDQVVRLGNHRSIPNQHRANRYFPDGGGPAGLGQRPLHVVSVVPIKGLWIQGF